MDIIKRYFLKTKLRYLLVILLIGFGSKSTAQDKKYKVGFSQCIGADTWRERMNSEIKREAYFHPEIELIFKDAEDNTAKQVAQIESLIAEHVDLLIVSPHYPEPLVDVVEKAMTKGIPVIILDRKINTDKYTAYIGANNYQIGLEAGKYAINLLPKGGKILEIWGIKGSQPAEERHSGFHDIVRENESYDVQEIGGTELSKLKGQLKAVASSLSTIDLIYAHTDNISFLTNQILEDIIPEKKFHIISVDGLDVKNGGMHMVKEGILSATFLYPTGGQEAIRLAAEILNGEDYQKENILVTTVIDSSNIEILKAQSDKLLYQELNIDLQQESFNYQVQLYEKQKFYNILLTIGIILILLLLAITISQYKAKTLSNQKLFSSYQEINQQKKQIEVISEKAEELHKAKLRFFTNISHEFRTPLMLILSSLHSLLEQNTIIKEKDSIQIAKKNALRLTKLVNQIMDFRKLDNNKLKVCASKNELIEFISEIIASFNKVAQERNIQFEFNHPEDATFLWFDKNMLDKVFFNLLSNAFKFTSNNGKIILTVNQTETDVEILVKDTGKGIEEKNKGLIFDRFFQVENYGSTGSGLGLALSKEIIEMHQGSIDVKSEKWLGTEFIIRLPKGNEHFENTDLIESESLKEIKEESLYIYELEEKPLQKTTDDSKHEKSILIIEDNVDLANYLSSFLSKTYKVYVGTDGISGLNLCFKYVPDLIICDLVLPEVEGIKIVDRLKNDIKTSHIPIIVVSAKSEDESKINTMRVGADAYLTKPFNFQFLLESIKSQLKIRELLKQHYLGINLSEEGSYRSIDEIFLEKFKNIISKNYSNPEFNVESIYRELGLSRIQLYRKVKALLGYSVHNYLVNIRLIKAKELLINSSLDISEIAYKVGFSSPTYFSTAFKNKFEVTPTQIREGYTETTVKKTKN